MQSIQLFSIIFILITIHHHIHQIHTVPITECPEFSTFNPCISRCPITCSNYRNPPECLPVCQVGCECEPGFIKVNKNPSSPCVKQYECQLYTDKRGQGSRPYPFYKRNGTGRLTKKRLILSSSSPSPTIAVAAPAIMKSNETFNV